MLKNIKINLFYISIRQKNHSKIKIHFKIIIIRSIHYFDKIKLNLIHFSLKLTF
jgi:hypothetical protein